MQKNQKQLTEQALSCLKCANTLASSQNHKVIHGDDLFWGIYIFIKNTEYFELFCTLLNLKNIKVLDTYYKYVYNIDFNQRIFGTKELPFNKKIHNKFNTFFNNNLPKMDFLNLFYISYSDLSRQCTSYLLKHWIDHKKLVQDCENVMKNKLIQDIGFLAFLEILHKLLISMNLDIKSVKTMKINNFEEIDNILDAVQNDLKENDSENTSWNTSTTTKDKEAKKMTVEYFWTDLTQEYKEWFIDPIIWRDKEINQIIFTLLRKNKNNPLLIGEAGVGKTAIVEWLAQRIAKWDVPAKLKNKRIFMLDMWTLVAGTKYRWDFEARMKSIIEEASDITKNIILFIDELHTIIWAGGQEANDAAQMIKPMLARWKIKLIWATTFDEYQKHIEKDAALKRRFQEITVDEPTPAIAEEILIWLKETYENFHGVQISNESIKNAVTLSQRYMLNKFLPDKALDIIDEACARKSTINQKLETDHDFKKNEKKLQKIIEQIESAIDKQDYFKAAELKEKEEKIKKQMQKIRTSKNIPIHLRPTIETQDIWQVLSDKTGIPSNIVNESELDKLRKLESDLQTKILWQQEAVKAVVKTLTKSRLSVIDRNKPIGSFLFLWPTWVWKTYLAKLIAQDYFWDPKALIRIDMSEFMEKYSISKLIGSPAWYVWYEEWWNLTEEVRRKPYSVILFDEIEKAAPDILNILLQILDEWRLKDSKWRWIDFKSTIIIMTSNIWSEEFAIKKTAIWFNTWESKNKKDKEFETIKERILTQTKELLSPELLNRIDYKIVFKALNKEILTNIFKNDLKEFLSTRKKNSDIVLPKYNDKKIKEIINKIYEPQYWARPIHRYIHDTIESEIIEKIMKKK